MPKIYSPYLGVYSQMRAFEWNFRSLPDTDTDDKIVNNSHNVIHLVPFLSRYRCSDTDMET